jgi:hypothetical protein
MPPDRFVGTRNLPDATLREQSRFSASGRGDRPWRPIPRAPATRGKYIPQPRDHRCRASLAHDSQDRFPPPAVDETP